MDQTVALLVAFWQAYGPLVLAVLGTLIGLAVWIARGEGKELAELVIQLVLKLSAEGWDSVTEMQVKDLAGRVYDGAYAWVGPPWFRVIPWRLFIKREMVQDWAWAGWQHLHSWYDSCLAQEVVVDAKAAREIPQGVRLAAPGG